MRFPRPRLSVRMMIGLVAVSALLVWGWMTYFDPVRLWKVAIRDKYDMMRRASGHRRRDQRPGPRASPLTWPSTNSSGSWATSG